MWADLEKIEKNYYNPPDEDSTDEECDNQKEFPTIEGYQVGFDKHQRVNITENFSSATEATDINAGEIELK